MSNPFLIASQYKPYDNFEARSGFYRYGAQKLLAKMAPLVDNRAPLRMLDAGCGTGNSALEILKTFPESRVLGVDSSGPMLAYARMKFGFSDAEALVADLVSCGETRLALYLVKFIRESAPHSARVDFTHADLMGFAGGAYDAVIGAQILHWLKPEREAAGKFAELCEKGAVVALSSSMSFYQPQKFSQDDVSYLRHPFSLAYFDVLSALIVKESGKQARAPEPKEKKHPEETVSCFAAAGFRMLEYDEIPLPKLSPELLLGYNLKVVPSHLGMFEGTGLDEPAQSLLVARAIQQTLSSHIGLLPLGGIPSDCCPVFVFRKD